jgi:hypothetical protein
VLVGLADGAMWSAYNHALRTNETFVLEAGKDRRLGLISRNISDKVTPEPFLLRLASEQIPLRENTTYTLQIELRSEYPIPTVVTVSIKTESGLVATARVTEMRLADHDS